MADCYVRVVHNFEGSGPEELHVEEGDVIKVIQYLSSHWLDAEHHGKSGLVPVKYTEKLEGAPELRITPASSSNVELQNNDYHGVSSSKQEGSGIHSQVQALYDFQARNSEELSFSAGALIAITADVDDVWFKGTCGGKTGLFPKNYVDMKVSSTAKSDLQSKPYAQAVYPFVGESDSELTFKEGQIIFLHQRSGSQWMIGELDGKTGLFPTSFVNIKIDLPSGGDQITNAENLTEKNNITSEKVHWTEGMEAEVLYPFTALYAEDLELRKGDLLTVLSVIDDVWIRGKLLNGESGMCPSAYLRPVVSAGGESAKVMAQSSSMKGGSGCVSSAKKISTGEQSSMDRSPLDTSITEDASPFLKPVCAVSPTKRTVMPSGQKPALKPKPDLGSPKRANSLSARLRPTAPKTPDESRSRKSFSLRRDQGGVKSPSGIFELSFNGEVGDTSEPRSRSSGRSLLDDTPPKGNITLPPPLSPLSPGGTSKLAPPKRKAPPPPKAKHNSRSDEVKPTTLNKEFPKSGSEGVSEAAAEVDAMAVSPKVATQMNPAASKQKAMVLPNSHKQDTALVDSSERGVPSGEGQTRAAGAASHLKLRSPQKEPWTPPRVRRPSPTKLRPTSVLYMGGESVNQTNKRLSGSLEDLRLGDAEESKDAGSWKTSLTTQDVSIPSSELPELEYLDKDIAKAEDQLQKEEKVFSGMKTIMQLVMTDPSKQNELASKVSRSQKKLEEWKEELKNLKARRSFLIKSYYAKKLQDELLALEIDLERQVRNKKSLETLLDVVGDSRRDEVQANLSTCLETIQEITGKITDLKVSAECGSPETSEASLHQRRAEQRQKVVREIINTERAYQRDLQLCVEYFLTALKQDKDVPQLDCESLFGNIEAVLAASVKLLPSIERAVEGKEAKDQELGKCFVDISEELKLVYATYCRNHDEAIALMEKYEEIPEIQAAFSRCLERIREHTKCWDLSSFLIKPVQRVLKYPLLLSELLKYTPEIHQDKGNLIRAVAAMTDVANAINEFKRRKDLVVKYKRVEDSGLGTMMQKLSWHSVVKKSSRFNQRITQFTGLVSQTVDESFNEEEKRIRSLEKAIKAFVKDVTSYLEEFRAASLSQFAMGDNITSYYQEGATCTQVAMYINANQRIGDHVLFAFENRIQLLVLRPLNDLISMFQGPQRLIQKRHDKCLDYDSWTNKIDKMKDREKLKLAKEELEVAKKNYEALNSQLLVDLPEFYQKALSLMKDCVRNFGLTQRRFYAGVLEEYIKLMQSPLIQSTEGDIVEEQAKKTLQVVDKFAELSFIPYSFVSKDGSRKKKKSGKLPVLPSVSSNPPSPKIKKNSDSRPVRLDETAMKALSPTGKQEPMKTPPQPQPRRKSSSTDMQQPEPADVTATEGQLYAVDYAFDAQNSGELTVNEGDVVSVLRCSDSTGNSEWWLVQCGNTAGYVPATFLTPTGNRQQQDDQEEEDDKEELRKRQEEARTFPHSFPGLYSVEFDFEASCPAELSIYQGQMVTVLKMHDLQGNQEWWLVEESESHKQGYVPASYLTLEEQII